MKVTDAANNTATKALSIAVAAAPQPPTSHHDVVAWRNGRHGVLNHAAGEWRNYALQLECECGNIASRIEPGGIDGRDLWNADDRRNCVVYGAGERRRK